MRKYRITESNLRGMIQEAVKGVLKESDSDVARAYRALEEMVDAFFVVLHENGYMENYKCLDNELAAACDELEKGLDALRGALLHPEGSHGELFGEPLKGYY